LRVDIAVALHDDGFAAQIERCHRVQDLGGGERLRGARIDADAPLTQRRCRFRPARDDGRAFEQPREFVGESEGVGCGEQRARADAGLEHDRRDGVGRPVAHQAFDGGRIDIRFLCERGRRQRHSAAPRDQIADVIRQTALEECDRLTAHWDRLRVRP